VAQGKAALPVEIDAIRFDERGLVPAVVQQAGTGEVLMVAYMNREALERTLQTGVTWFYSRSRQRLWQKGETSGNVQRVVQVRADCDFDTLLVEVEQTGEGACHTGQWSCFHHRLAGGEPGGGRETGAAGGKGAAGDQGRAGDAVVQELYRVIAGRKAQPVEGSYTSYLFEKGLDKILKKIGEETSEVILAAKNQDPRAFVAESADLLYHLLVAMVEMDVEPGALWEERLPAAGGGGSEDARRAT